MFLNISVWLHSHHHNLILKHFLPVLKETPLSNQSLSPLPLPPPFLLLPPSSSSPTPKQSLIYFVSVELLILNISNKWNHTICVFCDFFHYLVKCFQGEQCGNMYKYFISFFFIFLFTYTGSYSIFKCLFYGYITHRCRYSFAKYYYISFFSGYSILHSHW